MCGRSKAEIGLGDRLANKLTPRTLIQDGYTPLMVAACGHRTDETTNEQNVLCVRALVKAGADLNCTDTVREMKHFHRVGVLGVL